MTETTAEPVRIMLVEDQADFRRLLAALLGRQADLEVVAEAGSMHEARGHAASMQFDVAVLDLGLPDGHGANLIPDLRRSSPNAAVLVLSASLDARNLKRAADAGAAGVLDKFATPGEVVAAVRRLGAGETPAQA